MKKLLLDITCFAWWLGLFPFCGLAAERPGNTGPTQADYAKPIEKLKQKLPKDFTCTIQKPFVVLGDESPAVVKLHSTNTVKWAVDRLKKEFFIRDPDEIIDVWLFQNKESYEKHTKLLFNDSPDTPFGFYSPRHHALIMNIATGGGTLVHEIVHPFMRANFPACPAWFNEGMGSLFEQCADKDGHIRGLTNWRLPALQKAIHAHEVPAFEVMMKTTDDEFYGRSATGTKYNQHYAQARYLCYYLQEKNLLQKFYRGFVAGAKRDPSGVETLKLVLGSKDLQGFQNEWEAFVLKLRVE
ncbi:MAG TPA: hypothetical protein VMZ27_09720 [Candidatus Saccharimonadales bacterium]|nr:hypothetical protein [Candidatus Saccharimonadales bacterium]